MFNVFITNLGKYNEGELKGEWVALPCYDLDAVYERIGIDEEYEETFITDVEAGFDFSVGEYESIEELNECAEELETSDADLVAAYLEATGGTLREALDNAPGCTWYPGETLAEVAYTIVEECYDLPEIVQRYFDYDAFAHDLSIDGYTETSGGVICMC